MRAISCEVSLTSASVLRVSSPKRCRPAQHQRAVRVQQPVALGAQRAGDGAAGRGRAGERAGELVPVARDGLPDQHADGGGGGTLGRQGDHRRELAPGADGAAHDLAADLPDLHAGGVVEQGVRADVATGDVGAGAHRPLPDRVGGGRHPRRHGEAPALGGRW
jgi:hypothetical protein